jgi:4-hydroxybenzoate polyprenyltransferase
MEAAFVFIALFAGIFGIMYFYLQSRHKERMSLIENGADAKLFKTEERKKPFFFSMLLGILFICLALGIGTGSWIDSTLDNRSENEVIYIMSVFFFLGIGFVTAYFFHKKELEKKND